MIVVIVVDIVVADGTWHIYSVGGGGGGGGWVALNVGLLSALIGCLAVALIC